jgi:hypothetical protein
VLVEEDIPEAISISEAFELASQIPELGFSRIKIAFVDRYADQAELNEFAEIVATNRGAFGRFFIDLAEAEDWLLKD